MEGSQSRWGTVVARRSGPRGQRDTFAKGLRGTVAAQRFAPLDAVATGQWEPKQTRPGGGTPH
eukprot:8034106-Heterocapsa_arctica.AAC.1